MSLRCGAACGAIDIVCLLALAAAVLSSLAIACARLFAAHVVFDHTFGPHEDGTAYCDEDDARCIPRRTDHAAPGTRGRSARALCDLLTAAAVEPQTLELPPCH